MSKIKVALPIEVPEGKYCWDTDPSPNIATSMDDICMHYDNPGGHSQCVLDMGELKNDRAGNVLKPKKCLALKEIRKWMF